MLDQTRQVHETGGILAQGSHEDDHAQPRKSARSRASSTQTEEPNLEQSRGCFFDRSSRTRGGGSIGRDADRPASKTVSRSSGRSGGPNVVGARGQIRAMEGRGKMEGQNMGFPLEGSTTTNMCSGVRCGQTITGYFATAGKRWCVW